MKKNTIKLIEPSSVSQQPPTRARRRQSVAAAPPASAQAQRAPRYTTTPASAPRAAHTSLASPARRAASASMMIMEAVLENWAWNRRTTIVCVCAHLFVLLHDLSNVSFYNLSHAFTRQPPKTKHVLPIENKSKGIC
jgi:hypothetical protein